MASIDRRTREMNEVRDRILDAARELFVTQGYEAVSLRKIAEAIDYTAPALYTHFKDKESILRALCLRDYGQLATQMAGFGEIADPIERIDAAGRFYIRFAVEHPRQFQFMFMTERPEDYGPPPEALARQGDPDQDGYAFLRHAVAQAIEQGLLRPGLSDAELVTQILWAHVHGIAALHVTHAHDPWLSWRSLELRTRVAMGAMMRGLLADPALADRLETPRAQEGGS